jgi:hypothetical protein
MAGRAGSTVLESPGSHAGYMSRPQAVADCIAKQRRAWVPRRAAASIMAAVPMKRRRSGMNPGTISITSPECLEGRAQLLGAELRFFPGSEVTTAGGATEIAQF